MASGKPFSVWLSGPLQDFATNRAKKDYGNRPSDYLRELVERDKAGRLAAGAPDETILLALAKRFAPTIESELALQLNHGPAGRPVKQGRTVARLLEALHEALKREFDAEAPFAIYSSVEEFAAILRQRPGMLRALDLVAKEATYFQGVNEPPAATSGGKRNKKQPAKAATPERVEAILATIATAELEALVRRRHAETAASTRSP